MIDFTTRMAQLLEAGFVVIKYHYMTDRYTLVSPDDTIIILDNTGRVFRIIEND